MHGAIFFNLDLKSRLRRTSRKPTCEQANGQTEGENEKEEEKDGKVQSSR
jgi:hypothetical protein